jgi:hypothetical protein
MKPALLLAAVALVVLAWMFRYEIIIGGPSHGMVLQLDRWTGNLYIWEPKPEPGRWERYK